MGIGIAVYYALLIEPWPFLGLLGAGTGTLTICFCRTQTMKLFMSMLVTACVGFASAQFWTWVTPVTLLPKPTSFMDIEGTITSISERNTGFRIILDDVVSVSHKKIQVPRRVRLSVKRKPTETNFLPSPGKRIRVTAALRPPPAPHLPGSYDFQRRAFFKGIGAYGFVIGQVNVIGTANPDFQSAVSQIIHQRRADIAARARDAGPGPPGAVAAAMLTGHRGTIPQETLDNMRDAGIAHLLAISGLHIGLAAGTVFVFIRLAISILPGIALRVNAKKIASICAISVALGYAVLAGLTVPTERAFLMSSLMLIGILIDRRAVSMRSVAWAAGLILLIHPESLLEPGYQMSFAAVVCLVSGYEWISKRKPSRRGWVTQVWQYAAGVMFTSIIAGVATAPYAIYHFQHVAVFGLIANMNAVPLAAFWVIPSGLIALVLYPLGLDFWPMSLMTQGIHIILNVAEVVSMLPGAATDIAPPSPWSLAGISLGGLWLCIWQSRIRAFGVVPIVIGVLFASYGNNPPDIIVDGRGRVVAVYDRLEQFHVSSKVKAKYAVDVWKRHSGNQNTVRLWDMSGQHTGHFSRCDVAACQFNIHGKTISVSLDESSLLEDCTKNDIIVALVPIRVPCTKPIAKVDWFDLWRYGTHAIYIRPEKIEIRTVNQARGNRPWVVQPPPKQAHFKPPS